MSEGSQRVRTHEDIARPLTNQPFKAGTSCQGHGKTRIYGNTQLAGIRSDRLRLHTPDAGRIFLTSYRTNRSRLAPPNAIVAEEKGWWEGEASPPEEAVPTPTQDSELGVRGRLGMLII